MTSDRPSCLEIFGGRKHRTEDGVKFLIFLRDPTSGQRYSLETPENTFERIVSLLGFGDDDAEYCEGCGALKCTRKVINSHGGDGGYSYLCMCQDAVRRGGNGSVS